MKNRLSSLLLLVALSGCGDPSLSDRAHEIAAAYCSHLFDCANAGNTELFFFVNRYGSEQNCADQLTQEIMSQAQLAATQDAIHRGTIHFDSGAAGRCVSDIRAVKSCEADALRVLSTSEACDVMLDGTVAQGGQCQLDEECLAGMFCQSTGNACGGTCQATGGPWHTVQLGATCNQDEDCVYGALCTNNGPLGGRVCRTVTYQATGAAGQQCVQEADTATTRTVTTCAANLGCVNDVCAAPLTLGTACQNGDTCVAGTICAPQGSFVSGWACTAVTTVGAVGATCTNLDQYQGGPITFCDHSRRLYCDGTGLCAALGNGTAGTACTTPDNIADQNTVDCNNGLYCDRWNTNTCQPTRAAGVSCQHDAECQSDTCINGMCSPTYCAL